MGQSQRRTGIALAEMLEQRALLAAVSDGGGTTLTISLGTGEDFAVVSNGTTYTFSVDTSFTNGGVASTSDFSSFGSTSLTLNASGLTRYSTINIIDSSATSGVTVTFNDSGANAYSDAFNVTLSKTLDTISFDGASDFGSNVLSATTPFQIFVGATVKATGGITLKSDRIFIDSTLGSLDAGSGTVTLRPNSSSRGIDLGTEDSNKLSLTDAELDRITAGKLTISTGNGGTTGITVSADINLSNNTTPIPILRLDTGSGAGNVTATSGGIVVGQLAINANGTVNVTDSTTSVTTLAIDAGTDPITFTNANDLTVGTVDGLVGFITSIFTRTITLNVTGSLTQTARISTPGSLLITGTGSATLTNTGNAVATLAANVSGAFAYTDSNDLTIGTVGSTSGVTAGGAVTIKSVGSSNKLTISSGQTAQTSAGGLTLQADKMDLAGNVTASGQGVTLLVNGASVGIDLGSAVDTTNFRLELSDAELDRISSSTLTIGSSTQNSTINFSAPISLGTTDLFVNGSSQLSFAAAGSLSMSGGDATLTVKQSITINGGASLTTTDGNLTLSANQQTPASSGGSVGVTINGPITTSGSGNIVIQGTGTDEFSGYHGVLISNNGTTQLGEVKSTSTAANAGTITLLGRGAANNSQNSGVVLSGANAKISSVNGAISVTGFGGTGTGSNYGVWLNAGQILSTGTGANAATITIAGTGVGASGTNNYGVRLEGTAPQISAADGAIQITGIGGFGTGSYGLSLATGTIQSTGMANVSLITDTIDINTSSASINAGSNIVTLKPNTASTPINLGGADVIGASPTLGLTDAELDRITAGTLRVGDASSGAITISADISPASVTTLHLTSGSTVTGTAGGVVVNSLAITAAGAASVTDATTDVTNVAISSPGFSVDFNDANGLTVTSVDGVDGISANDLDVNVSGNLTIANTSATNDITTTQSLNLNVTANDAVLTTAAGAHLQATGGSTIKLVADEMDLAATMSATQVRLENFNVGELIILGTNPSQAGTLELSDAELDLVSGIVRVGRDDASASGNITVTAPISLGTLIVRTGAGIVDGNASGTDITATNLTLRTVAGVGNAGADQVLEINATSLAFFNGSGGSILLNEANGLSLANIDGFNPSSASDVNISSTTGDITVTNSTSVTSNASMTLNAIAGNVTVSNALTSASGNITLQAGADVVSSGASGSVTTTSGNLFFTGDSDSSGSGTITFDRPINVGSGTATFSLNSTNGTVSDVISGTGNVVKSGSGTLTFTDPNTYSGTTTVNAGRLNLTGSITSNTTVASGGTLGGTGTINSANTLTLQSGGHVAPGNSPGILNSGSVSFASGSSFDVEIGGTSPGNASTNHDQLVVTGTVNLGSATLTTSAFNGFVPTAGNTFAILLNDSSDAITGTFNGLAEGATIANFLGTSLSATISYVGNGDSGTTGNDVVLTVVVSGTLTATLSSGNLTITDTDGTKNNNLTVSVSGSNLVVTDAAEAFISAPAGGTLSNGNKTLTIPAAAVTGTLTINSTGGTDTIDVSVLSSTLLASLIINAGAGTDTVNLNGNVTFASNKSLSVTAETLNTAASADLVTSGAGVITITADDVALNSTSTLQSASTVTFLTQTAARAINLGTNTAGSLSLTDSELDHISAGTINIGDTNSGAITFGADITRATNTNVNLTTGTNNNIAFGVFSLNAGSGGDVSLTTSGTGAITSSDNTGTDLTAGTVTLTAGLGGIATSTNFLRLAATTVTASTTSNASINLAEADSVTIGTGDLNAGTGTTTIGGGTFLTGSGRDIFGPVTVASGGTLGGTGSTGAITAQSGGHVAPGTSPGILNSGNVSFSSGSNFDVELNGTTVGTQYDQLNVTGAVSLGSATLNVTLGFIPTNGSSFTIINNDDTDAVTGIFNGLPEHAAVVVGSDVFEISYVGGNGNDVVLTRKNPEAASLVVTTASDSVNQFDNLTSLREAVSFANSDPDASTITFDAGINGQEIDLTGGQLVINTSVTITGNGLTNTLIDGQNSTRLFHIDDLGGSIDVTLTGLTLKNGFVDSGNGGAILSNATLTITNSLFTNNSADKEGGALFNNGGIVTVTNSTFSANHATGANGGEGDGGAILNNGTMTITGSTFSQNTASDDAGAIDNQASSGLLTINESSFLQNAAGDVAGAIRISGGTALITGSTFSQNFAPTDSGAMHIDGETTIRNSTFSSNSTNGDGGAIYNHGDVVTIINSTLTLNRADADGDGETGGGIHSTFGATTTILNTIVSGNLAGSGAGSANDIGGDNVQAASTFNLIGDAGSAGGLTHGVNGNQVGVNPLLGALADNGGPTQTHALLPGSPAINAGSNANVPGDITTDQRGIGFPRFVGTVDVGAFEIEDGTPPTVTVNIVDASLNDSDNSSNVTFEFSEDVTGFDASDLTVSGGTLSGFTVIDGNSFSATFTATNSIEAIGSVSVGIGYTDAVGNVGVAGSDNVSIDTLNPTVTVNIVDASLSDSDNSSNVTFEFSENVTGFDANDVTVSGGTLSGFTAIDGNSFSATFTATNGIEATGSVSVGTGYTDAVGNIGVAGSDTVTIDTLNPTADVVDVTPDPRTTGAGTVSVNFSESVTGVGIGDFTLTRGGNSVDLSGLLVSGSGASYSIDLSSVTNAAGSYVLTLVASASGIQDLAGNLLSVDASDAWVRANPTVSLSINKSTIAEAAGVAVVTATLNQITDVDVTVTVGFTGSAVKDTDYSVSAATIVITAGNLTGTMSVTATQDGLLEISETVFVDIIGVTNGLENGTQQVVTSIIDDDHAPTITSTATPSIVENTTTVLTVTATDTDTPPQTVTFSISGGADQALFQISSSGVLSFKVAPDFENPQDNGANNFYDVQVTANDGNLGTDVQNITVAVTDADEIAPTVAITTVVPDPRNSAVSTITIVFSEVVTGFNLADLTLTRDTGAGPSANLLTGSQTLTSSDGGRTYTLGNLSGLTAADGAYLLTLTAASSGIIDVASNALVTGATETWTMDTTVPTVSITAVSPDPRNVPVGAITIVFSEAVSGFNLADLSLTRDTGSGAGSNLLTGSQTLMTSDNITFTLTNLTTITGPQGAYILTLTASASGIVDQANNALASNGTESWTMDTTALTADITDVTPDPRNNSVSAVTIVFSKPISGFALNDLVLTRNGGVNLLTGSQTLNSSDGGMTWTLGNLSGLTGTAGTYLLSLAASGSGIIDAASNALAADASDTWVVDTTAPTADIIDVTPDPRSTHAGVVTITFSESVSGVDISDFTLTRNGNAVSLSALNVSGNGASYSFDLSNVTTLAGSYLLTLNASGSGISDTAANTLSGNASDAFVIDLTAPTADVVDVTPDPRNSNAGTVTINFGESVSGVDISDFTLTRNGSPVSLSSLSVSGSGASYSINLSSVTVSAGDYVLSLNASGSGIVDTASNPLTTNASDSWTTDLTVPTASIAAVTPDPRNSAVSTLTIIFSEAISGFDLSDLSLTRDTGSGSGSNLLTGSQTLNSTDGGVTFTLGNLTSITGLEGTYLLTLTASGSSIIDTASNALAANATETWTVDTTAPTATISTVTSPRNSAVNSLTITFSAPITGFDLSDLTLTRDTGSGPGANLLTGTQTLSSADGGLTFTLGNLTSITGLQGTYSLTLNASGSGIEDAANNALLNDANRTWSLDSTAPGAIISIVTPDPRSTSVNTLTITFTEAITGFDLADLKLTRNGGSNLLTGSQTLSSTDGGVTFTLGNLSGLTGTQGTYLLTLTAASSGILDVASNILGSNATESWVVDTTAPTADITNVTPDPRNTPVGSITIVFSEAVTGLDLSDLSLTRDGGANLLTGGESLDTSDNITYVISGLTTLTGPQGSYLVTLTASGSNIVDAAGNALAANASDSWTTDTTSLTGAITAVTPDPRNSSVSNIAIVFSKPVTGFDLADLRLTRNGGSNLLTGSQTLTSSDGGTNWSLGNLSGLTGSAGTYLLTLTASGSNIIDAATNELAADASDSWTVDLTVPTADITDVTPDPRNSSVSNITIVFSEAVTGLDVSDLSLTRNSGSNLLTGSQTVSSSDGGLIWTLGNLTSLTGAAGSYSLTLTASGANIRDTASNLLAANASDTWTVETTAPTATITAVTPDPRNNGVSNITITFTEPVTGFDLADLSLTRDTGSGPGSNLLTGSQTLSSSDGGVTYTLGNLSGLTNAAGSYSLTLTAASSGIIDAVTNAMTTNASDSWTVDTTAPTAAITAVSPDPRNTSVGSITITFSEAVTGFNLADLTLTRDSGSGPGSNLLTGSQTLTSSDGGMTYTLGNLASVTNTQGTFTLTLTASGSGIADSATNALVTNATESWSLDSTAPGAVISAVTPDPRNSSVNTITISFNEIVTGFDLADLKLTRNGGSNLLTGSQTLTSSDGGMTYTLGNLSGLTGTSGTYLLTLTASSSGITDAVGNTFGNNASESWLTDTVAPTADITDVSPDPRNTSVSSITIVFSEAVTGLDVSDLSLTLNGGTNLLTGGESLSSSDGGATYTLGGLTGLTNADGTYLLTLTASGSNIIDVANNSLSGNTSDSWNTDLTGPNFTSNAAINVPENTTAIMNVIATDAHGPVTFAINSDATGGPDRAKFNLTSGGVLTFLTARNFESPADVGTNNVYNVTVTATDSFGNTSTQEIAVTITNVDEISTRHFARATYFFTSATAGRVELFNPNQPLIVEQFSTEPVQFDITADEIEFFLPATNDVVTLEDVAGANSLMKLSGPTFADVIFSIAQNQHLDLHGGNGNDTFNINNLDPTFVSSLTVNGELGNDQLIVDLAGNGSLLTGGLTFNGGLGPKNTLVLRNLGERFDDVTYRPTTINNGSFVLRQMADGIGNDITSLIAFSHLNGVTINGTAAADLLIELPNSNDSAALTDIPGSNTERFTGGCKLLPLDFPLSGVSSVRINGNAGNDSLKVASLDNLFTGLVILIGGDGNDSLETTGAKTVTPKRGNIPATTKPINTRLSGGNGNDKLIGGLGNDTLLGEAGNDTLIGNNGHDLMSGGSGNDRLDGENGNDTLLGEAGNDTLDGEAGADLLLGGDGNDKLNGGSTPAGQHDTVAGQAGDDTISDPKSEIDEAFTFDFDKLLV